MYVCMYTYMKLWIFQGFILKQGHQFCPHPQLSDFLTLLLSVSVPKNMQIHHIYVQQCANCFILLYRQFFSSCPLQDPLDLLLRNQKELLIRQYKTIRLDMSENTNLLFFMSDFTHTPNFKIVCLPLLQTSSKDVNNTE